VFCLIGRDVDGYSSTFGAFQFLGLSDPQSEQLAQGRAITIRLRQVGDEPSRLRESMSEHHRGRRDVSQVPESRAASPKRHIAGITAPKPD
jgi:hypothetical protein